MSEQEASAAAAIAPQGQDDEEDVVVDVAQLLGLRHGRHVQRLALRRACFG